MSDRDKRALVGFVVAVLVILIIRNVFLADRQAAVVKAGETVAQAEKRLVKLREVAATVPGKQRVLTQVDADLAAREKAIMDEDTAPEAQAHLLVLARKVAAAEGIEIRGGEFGQAKVFGSEYGEVFATVSFTCPIEKFVNFMAGISHEPELVGPSEIRINSQNAKEKTVTVRMTLGGLVAKKLVPEKKGFQAF
jgi:hypothetical protein